MFAEFTEHLLNSEKTFVDILEDVCWHPRTHLSTSRQISVDIWHDSLSTSLKFRCLWCFWLIHNRFTGCAFSLSLVAVFICCLGYMYLLRSHVFMWCTVKMYFSEKTQWLCVCASAVLPFQQRRMLFFYASASGIPKRRVWKFCFRQLEGGRDARRRTGIYCERERRAQTQKAEKGLWSNFAAGVSATQESTDRPADFQDTTKNTSTFIHSWSITYKHLKGWVDVSEYY